MDIRTYEVTLTGKSPLLMHWDNIEWSGALKKWREDPDNKSKSVAGDDRSPAFTWIGSVYRSTNEGPIAMLSDNLQRCMMEGGAQVQLPGGRKGKTFKQQSQSGMMPGEESWPLIVNGKTIQFSKIWALRKEDDFEKHQEMAIDLGFQLYVKRARIGASKHVRVRPRFDQWSCAGTIQVWDEKITERALKDILRLAGDHKGLGDWRPSSPRSPGPFGRFAAEVKSI